MVGLGILVTIKSEQRYEFLQTTDLFCCNREVDQSRIGCSIFETVGNPNQFLWVEKWTDQVLLDEYMKTERFKALLGAIQVLGELNSFYILKLDTLNEIPG